MGNFRYPLLAVTLRKEYNMNKRLPFLPYGYNVPQVLEECYTWEQAIAFIAQQISNLDERVTALEENTNEETNSD